MKSDELAINPLKTDPSLLTYGNFGVVRWVKIKIIRHTLVLLIRRERGREVT